MRRNRRSIIFDLDGTLVDTVYHHVLAWHAALQEVGLDISVWRIHRRIGMSGGLLAHALARESGQVLDAAALHRLQQVHGEIFLRSISDARPLPGANDLLNRLSELGVPWAIATSGRLRTAQPALNLLVLPENTQIVTRDDVQHAKPDPDVFLEAARRLGTQADEAVIVGDSVWDLLAARRAHALGVGLQCGGYGRGELEAAGAFRVYDDPSELLAHLDEIGFRP
jgi:HAD superfamily hydrolase (TIGR01509 family)